MIRLNFNSINVCFFNWLYNINKIICFRVFSTVFRYRVCFMYAKDLSFFWSLFFRVDIRWSQNLENRKRKIQDNENFVYTKFFSYIECQWFFKKFYLSYHSKKRRCQLFLFFSFCFIYTKCKEWMGIFFWVLKISSIYSHILIVYYNHIYMDRSMIMRKNFCFVSEKNWKI